VIAVPSIPDAEYGLRRARLLEAFVPLELDAVLLIGARNWYRDHALRYVAGYDGHDGSSMIFWRLDAAAPILLLGTGDGTDRVGNCAADIEVRRPVDLLADIADLVRGLPPRTRLGVAGGECMGFTALDVLPIDIEAALRDAAPGLELVDAGGALGAVRMIRSENEIAVTRAAAAIADIGAEAFLATARAGVAERDIFTEVWRAMQSAGAEDVHISMCRGPGSFWPHPPSDVQLAAGDIVSIELSPRVGGYFSQANRMCFVGLGRREARELEALARNALDVALSVIKAGVEAKAVVQAVGAMVGKSALATMDVGGVHRIGHGCGGALDEGPFLTSASTTVLQPNMTMALHPILYLPYRHALLMLGDYVRITEAGAEVLTRPQAEIPIV
jgi:Xaa-Pro aminopeptidase